MWDIVRCVLLGSAIGILLIGFFAPTGNTLDRGVGLLGVWLFLVERELVKIENRLKVYFVAIVDLVIGLEQQIRKTCIFKQNRDQEEQEDREDRA